MTLDEIIIGSDKVAVNRHIYKRKLNNATIAFNDKIKTGLRQRILPFEGQLTIDAVETFWAAYGAVKEEVSKISTLGGKKFADLYSLYIAASFADQKYSTAIEEPKFYSRLLNLEITGDEYLLIDNLMRNFIYETQACNSGKALASITRGFFQRIQELARAQLNQDHPDSLEVFENSYRIKIADSFTAQGTNIKVEDPSAGKPNELVTWDDIGGYDAIKEDVMFHCHAMTDANMKAMGYVPPKGICFHGWPGTGKTLLAKAIACQIGMPFHKLSIPDILSKWVGETEQKVFEQLTKQGVHFIDEADALFKKIEGHDSAVAQRVINIYAEVTDGFNSNNNLYILATNSLDLEEKIKRAGRTDEFYFFGLPDEKAIRQIYGIHAKKLQEHATNPILNGVNLDMVSHITHMVSMDANKKNPKTGIVPADCANILKKTHRNMLRTYWRTKQFRPMGTNDVIETIKNYNLEERA